MRPAGRGGRAYEQVRLGLVLLVQVQVLTACGWVVWMTNESAWPVAVHTTPGERFTPGWSKPGARAENTLVTWVLPAGAAPARRVGNRLTAPRALRRPPGRGCPVNGAVPA